FFVEANEHLQTIAAGLLALEKTGGAAQRDLLSPVFRSAHSLKGAARAVGFTDIETVCQELEDILASWNRGDTAPTATTLNAAHDKLDTISAAITLLTTSVEHPRQAETHIDATIRISINKLNAQLTEAEEMLTAKLTTAQRSADL